MRVHILQAKHNTDFHINITVVFYTALHLIKALAKKNNKRVGNTHSEIFKNIRNSPPGLLPLSTTACNMYNDLYTYSHSVRYDGIGHLIDMETWNALKKEDHKVCEKLMGKFILHMDSRGISMN